MEAGDAIRRHESTVSAIATGKNDGEFRNVHHSISSSGNIRGGDTFIIGQRNRCSTCSDGDHDHNHHHDMIGSGNDTFATSGLSLSTIGIAIPPA